MVVLGPSTIEHGVNPATAFFACSSDGMAMLGPARGPSSEVDPIARFFLVLGKLISVRRILAPLPPGIADGRGKPEHPITQCGAIQESILAFNRDEEFNVVWQPLASSIQHDAIDPMRRQTADLDQRTRRFVANETEAVLSIDPTLSVEERMRALNTYLRVRGFTVEANSEGFLNFIAGSFNDPQGERINLPTSNDPTFPDAWITPQTITPGPTRRAWNVIW